MAELLDLAFEHESATLCVTIFDAENLFGLPSSEILCALLGFAMLFEPSFKVRGYSCIQATVTRLNDVNLPVIVGCQRLLD